MPYGIRYLARETLLALKVSPYVAQPGEFPDNVLQAKYPDAPEEVYASCISRLVYYRYINPAIMSVLRYQRVASL